jgi:hypothetical protein
MVYSHFTRISRFGHSIIQPRTRNSTCGSCAELSSVCRSGILPNQFTLEPWSDKLHEEIHIESTSWLHNICTYDHLLYNLYARSVGKTGGMKAIPLDLSATDIENLGIHTAATSTLHILAQTLTTNVCLALMNTTC